MIGQVLYLETEAAGVRSTGIGCYTGHGIELRLAATQRGARSALRPQTLPVGSRLNKNRKFRPSEVYFDDPVHVVLGPAEIQFHSLYHFTVGVPAEDHRFCKPVHHTRDSRNPLRKRIVHRRLHSPLKNSLWRRITASLAGARRSSSDRGTESQADSIARVAAC